MGRQHQGEPDTAVLRRDGRLPGHPNEGDSDKGFDLSFSSTGVLVPLEVGWLPSKDTGRFPGIYKIGGYYNSSDTPTVGY
jgi:carbohydrate-selective porin OprB